ncbi:MAG: restriction endonuclease [Candidatus Riflebacteria bacterium]
MDIIYQYPPELFNLLVDTIPLLCRSKTDCLLFFQGAGVEFEILRDLDAKLKADRNSTNKFEIVRTVIKRLNEKGEGSLRERREILKRVTQYDDFSTCWPNDQLKAKGLVSEIQRVINVKDSFTRLNQEREKERLSRIEENQKRINDQEKKRLELETLKKDFFSLFSSSDPHARGKLLEGALNRIFAHFNVLIREAFTIKGTNNEGVVEQIDGVVEIDGEIYLVEMKWWAKPIDKGEVSQHLVGVYHRSCARGIFISASGYTPAAILICKEALLKGVFVLCDLKEIVFLLERGDNFKEYLKEKIKAAIIEKNPYVEK